jgi:hypothetical protein
MGGNIIAAVKRFYIGVVGISRKGLDTHYYSIRNDKDREIIALNTYKNINKLSFEL